jgi:hypothetical protein
MACFLATRRFAPVVLGLHAPVRNPSVDAKRAGEVEDLGAIRGRGQERSVHRVRRDYPASPKRRLRAQVVFEGGYLSVQM